MIGLVVGVLQEDLSDRDRARFLYREGRECTFMEAAQDQLLFARVCIDVSDCIDARNVGFESFGVHGNLMPLEIQPPIRDGAELRRQAEEHQNLLDVE